MVFWARLCICLTQRDFGTLDCAICELLDLSFLSDSEKRKPFHADKQGQGTGYRPSQALQTIAITPFGDDRHRRCRGIEGRYFARGKVGANCSCKDAGAMRPTLRR